MLNYILVFHHIQKLSFKFKTESYNNELLYIYGQNNNYAILDNCSINNEKLLCESSNEKTARNIYT